jgi:hypothetical protein
VNSSQVMAEGGGALGFSASAEAPETARASRRRFVSGLLGSFFVALASVLAFNVVIDPLALAGTGVVPTAVEPDRSIKLVLLQHLGHGPQIHTCGGKDTDWENDTHVNRFNMQRMLRYIVGHSDGALH